MSEGIDTRKYIGEAKCPECGFDHMNIYADGTFRCGNCLSGGMLICTDPFRNGKHTHAHLIDVFREKLENPVVLNFDCKVEEHGKERCPYFR